MTDLKGKNALVTGATRGIGKAIALALADSGANLLLSGRNSALLQAVADEIKTRNVKVSFVAGEVQDSASAQAMVDACLREFGSLDILVNNAGITKDNLLLRMKDDEWNDVLDVNLKGCFNTIRAAAKPMMKQRSGKIINISSVVGVMGNAGQANYSASKAGLIGLTKSVAKELASRNIQVNAIAPGYIITDMTESIPEDKKDALKAMIPLGKLGEATAIANAVIFLASNMSDYITGQTLNVDGGMIM